MECGYGRPSYHPQPKIKQITGETRAYTHISVASYMDTLISLDANKLLATCDICKRGQTQ